MSTVAVYTFPARSGVLHASSSAASIDARTLGEKYAEMASSFLRSALGQARIGDPLAALEALYRDCSEEDWDAEGAKPVTRDALREAEMLVSLLPSWVPIPDFLPEPTGGIAFEWYKGPGRVYVLSVSGQGYVYYAGLFGAGNEEHGKAVFEDFLPAPIVEQLRRLHRG